MIPSRRRTRLAGGAERLHVVGDPASDPALWVAVSGLATHCPELSAARLLSAVQRAILATLVVGVAVPLVLAPIGTLAVLIGLLSITQLVTLGYKVWLYVRSRQHDPTVRIEDDEARAIPAADLPVYTVLVPAYREPESMGELLAAIDRFEYPRDRLDVKVLLEAGDDATYAAAARASGPHVEIIEVPDATPKTKPKALNYGLTRARGELVTIYDAEDAPEPLQLRRVVAAFARSEPDVVCLQARLDFYNARQNLITRWFTLEYATWFADFLPGIVASGAPVPLGGTSNHFRTRPLASAGAWDPYNVTEDADLGVRLARLGYRVGLVDSVTGEEATSEFVNWVRQRSRWYKGYLQTWLVHLRRPRKLWRQLGTRGAVGFNLMVGGTPVLTACNLVTWAVTLVWLITRPGWIGPLFPPWAYYLALIAFVVGNTTVVYLGILSARLHDNEDLVWVALIVPLYWLMMGLAALKAVSQLVVAPSFWEKTVHGMGDRDLVDLVAAESTLDPNAIAPPVAARSSA